MAHEEQLAILKQGPEAWNQWRTDNPAVAIELSGANLSEAHLVEAHLDGANLAESNLRRADLRGAHLHRANLGRVILPRAYLFGADLRDADLSGANLIEANLSQADLSGANFIEADLRNADLSRAHLRGADLSAANLSGANLSGAHLDGTRLEEAHLEEAHLEEADLSGAHLKWADLRGAHLDRANLSNARMYRTILVDVDLSTVKGLDKVRHDGPSGIGIDTIYRSQGKIPEVFLRGAGVPDNFITYMGSLTGKAFEFYSCFISYSTKDQEFAERLHADLQSKGVRCWFAPEDVQGGKKLHEQLYEAIRLHDKLLLVLSPNSLQSEWVMTEIRRTRRLEVEEQRRRLFPIRLVDYNALRQWECFDADTGKDLAIEVREYFVPDFSSWKDHDAYSKAFDHLLRDLKQADKTGNA